MFQPAPFGKYFLLERVAVGGMAEVFRGKLVGVQGVEKDVAVKLVLPQYARQREFVESFVEEARLSVQLTHGNVVPVYELGEQDGVLFLAMEYVRGKNLGELLDACVEQHVRMPLVLACHVVAEACRGLDYAHRKVDEHGHPLHIVHRDVSPQNILVSYEGDVKLVDFGIARVRWRAQRTQAGIVKGKCGYMSPEQASGQELDARTDVFAAGVVLYECLTLTRLFAEESDLETLEKVRLADIPTPSKLNPEISPALEAVIFRALAKDPARRFATAGELADALSQVIFRSDAPDRGSAALSTFARRLFAKEIAAEEAKRRELEAASAPQLRAHVERLARGGAAAPITAPVPATSAEEAPRKAEVRRSAKALERETAKEVERLARLAGEAPDHLDEPAPKRGGLLVPALVLALIAALGFAFRGELAGLAERLSGEKAAPRYGTLTVETEPPGANVYFAGALVGVSSLRVQNVDPDQAYELVLTLDGYPPTTRRIAPADWERAAERPALVVKHVFRKK